MRDFQIKIQTTFVLAWLLAGSVALQAAPLTAAVYNFTDGDTNSGGYAGKVTALLTADLTTDTNLIMLERADLNKALNEQAFDVSGMVSSDAASKIGQLTGAKVLVSGQVINLQGHHAVIVANIIGTETGRLFAAKVEGSMDNLTELTTDLSRKISQTVTDQRTNLEALPEESHTARLARIMKDIQGTNRPSVSISIEFVGETKSWRDQWGEFAFGKVLQEAGFPVLDDKADKKADILIIGNSSSEDGPRRGDLRSRMIAIEVKVQERRSGAILTFARAESTVVGATGPGITSREGRASAVDKLAEQILPILAK